LGVEDKVNLVKETLKVAPFIVFDISREELEDLFFFRFISLFKLRLDLGVQVLPPVNQ